MTELEELRAMVLAQQIVIRILAKHAQVHNPDFKEEVTADFETQHSGHPLFIHAELDLLNLLGLL